jgi:Bifunctional DNA primase/polymerase, N-terminal
MTGTRLRYALTYAARGWPVFPCQVGQKAPATAHGHLDATTDPAQITAWFSRNPSWNLAIATGAPGPDVLDVDDHGPAGNGYAAFARLSKAGLLDGAARFVRIPAGDCTPTSPARPSATATCPPITWTSGPAAATSWPRPPASTASRPAGLSRVSPTAEI